MGTPRFSGTTTVDEVIRTDATLNRLVELLIAEPRARQRQAGRVKEHPKHMISIANERLDFPATLQAVSRQRNDGGVARNGDVISMIQIGAPLASDFSNPLGVLGDCHRRVEHFLHLLVTVTEQAHGGPLNAEQHDALAGALRYFAEAAPKHTADEEESLFPRLRASRHPEAPAAVAIAESLSRDHDVAAAHHAAVDTLGRRWLADGHLAAAPTRELAARLADLATMYREHIAVEDGDLFPLARRVLSAAAVAAIGREMALRRGLDPAGAGGGRTGSANGSVRQEGPKK